MTQTACLTNDGLTRTYEWDAANRCVAINSGTHRTELSYDGFSREIRRVERENGTVTQTKQFIWEGWQRSEERDGNNQVTKRFCAQGEQIAATSYYYAEDHLGSIRELADSSGLVQVRYDYDPYGSRTKLTGSVDGDFGFTGYYVNSDNPELAFAPLRIYSSSLTRWISRDPLGERGGLNLYAYVFDDPINAVDPLGLKTCWKLMLITSYGRWEGETKASTGRRLRPGDVAVADMFYAQPDQPFDPKHRNPQYAYPLGTKLNVYTSTGTYKGKVADVGRGHIKTREGKYPSGVPADAWLDLWFKNKRLLEEWDWVSMEVDDCAKCPPGWIGDW